MQYRALIFDIGNVLLSYDPKEIRRVFTGSDQVTVRLPVGYINWPELEAYARGQLSTIEFVRHLEEMTRRKINVEEFDAAWESVFHLNEPLAQLIPALGEKYKLLLLSNTNDSHWRCCKEKLASILNYFDAHILSFEVNLLKPDPNIFLKAAALVRESPESCLFIDDTEEHVLAARVAGLQAISYKGLETNAFLRSLL